jgi:hypothetical protein
MSFLDEEHAGNVALSLFIFSLGFALEIIGLLLWNRKVPQNSIVGIKLKSMGDNKGKILQNL